ncbi:MAG: phosphoenolpyruvate--protein phosphotransferase [Myxococcota bacterium]
MADRSESLLREVGRLLIRSHDLGETLDNLVRLVSRRMHSAVCSIYLLDDSGQGLELRATRGLRPEAVGRVRLAAGEGIVGRCLDLGEPISVPDVRLDPRFLPFPDAGEERFRSLLAVPLFVRDQTLGVLTVQTGRPRDFSADEIELLQTIAVQVAAIALNARLLDQAGRDSAAAARARSVPHRSAPRLGSGASLRGIAVSPGLAEGPVHLQVPPLDLNAVVYHPARSVSREWRAVERALRETIRQLSDLRRAVGERLGEEFAEVFTTHIMILRDDTFREKLRRRVEESGNGVRALIATMREYTAVFQATSDAVTRERATDIEDVVRRAVGELIGLQRQYSPLSDGVIVVAERIAPSDFALLETEKVAAILTEHGGPASHAAIFARSLGIPSVTGLPGLIERLDPTDRLIVDGIEGVITVNPSPAQLDEYAERRIGLARAMERLGETRDEPVRTLDGRDIRLYANIGGLNDLEFVRRSGARGVGLFRTEILALFARGFPEEQEQARIYRRVAEAIAPEWVTVRTFDLGGEKALPGMAVHEENPQLGWRSIRMLLDLDEVLDAQLRAILRANTAGNLRILIPMLTSLEELDRVRGVLDRACREVGATKAPPLGAMIETPAAVVLAERIASEVDFLAAGTNDLVQYTLAVDRENERVAASYDPFHPAVLEQLRRLSRAARASRTALSVCGELAGNPLAVPLLIGLGFEELSMAPSSVALVRPIVRRTDTSQARALALDLECCGRVSEVRASIEKAYTEMGIFDEPDLGPLMRRMLRPNRVDSRECLD